jgi:hypothetical protein
MTRPVVRPRTQGNRFNPRHGASVRRPGARRALRAPEGTNNDA